MTQPVADRDVDDGVPCPVAVDGGAGEVPTNSGIVVVYDIQHALQAIDVFMAVSSPDTGEVKECDGGP